MHFPFIEIGFIVTFLELLSSSFFVQGAHISWIPGYSAHIFVSATTWSNRETIVETRSYIWRRRSLSSSSSSLKLFTNWKQDTKPSGTNICITPIWNKEFVFILNLFINSVSIYFRSCAWISFCQAQPHRHYKQSPPGNLFTCTFPSLNF